MSTDPLAEALTEHVAYCTTCAEDDPRAYGWCSTHMGTALAAHDAQVRADERRRTLYDAADRIQALHPGEVKNSVVFLRRLAEEDR